MFQPSGQQDKNTGWKVKTKILQVEHASTRHASNTTADRKDRVIYKDVTMESYLFFKSNIKKTNKLCASGSKYGLKGNKCPPTRWR